MYNDTYTYIHKQAQRWGSLRIATSGAFWQAARRPWRWQTRQPRAAQAPFFKNKIKSDFSRFSKIKSVYSWTVTFHSRCARALTVENWHFFFLAASDRQKNVPKRAREPIFGAALELHEREQWIYHPCVKKVLSPLLCQYIHTYIYTYIHVCIHTYIHTCKHTYMHT